MKGNVTCSCGHSWSKSDSSKKDASVCHICGKDNTMKDGGWLEKYNDGGPIQPNYNDYSVSAGEGFQGDGYSNVGRDYSPAWGGQFKEGGKVPATKQDSLNLYNNTKKVLDYYNSKRYEKKYEKYNIDPSYSKYVHENNALYSDQFNQSNKSFITAPRVPLSSGKSAQMSIPESMYYKKLDDNRYMQRENANAILDTRAPMQLFDKRIAPTASLNYINDYTNDVMSGDIVNMYAYDPVLVKPASMLTPQERALRIERYGEYSGIPNTKPKSKRALDKSETSFMEEYTKKYPPIYVSDSKDPRIGKYAPKGNQYLYKKPTQPVIYQKPEPTPQSTIDFMEGNYGQEPITEIPISQSSAYGEVVDPRTGYTHMTRQGSPMYPMVGQNVPEMEEGGPVKRFMQPTETFKNLGYNSKTNGMSTELSTSIGGPGEVYLVPGYRQGKILQDPEGVFNAYGEHLGGPFKTVKAAEDFGKLRHQYVEKNQNIPAPFKTRDYAMGGSMPGSVGFMYARTNDPAPSNGKYAKKTKASAQNGTEMRYYQEGLDFKPKSISRDGSQLVKLDQLTNFTNYNTKQPGGWLDKYQ